MFIFWSISIFMFSYFLFQNLKHTALHSVVCLMFPEDRAVEIEASIVASLRNAVLAMWHVYLYHFFLTYITLRLFGSHLPCIGGIMAGLVALFPYFPKYYLVPLPLFLSYWLRGDRSNALRLALFIFVPYCIGDDWVFAGVVEGSAKLVALS